MRELIGGRMTETCAITAGCWMDGGRMTVRDGCAAVGMAAAGGDRYRNPQAPINWGLRVFRHFAGQLV